MRNFYSLNNILESFLNFWWIPEPYFTSLSHANLFLFNLGLTLASLRFRLRQLLTEQISPVLFLTLSAMGDQSVTRAEFDGLIAAAKACRIRWRC